MGVEKMPLESFWLLFPSELWQMGYRRCDTLGTMPEHLPSGDVAARATICEDGHHGFGHRHGSRRAEITEATRVS
jgi:hypothetical protein